MNRLNVFLVSLVFSAVAAHAGTLEKTKFESSPFIGVCQNTVMIPYKFAKSDEDRNYWNRAIQECKINAVILPDTGFFATIASRLGEENDQLEAVDFLDKVGVRTIEHLDYNNKVSELISHCTKASSPGEASWFQAKLDEAQKSARDNPELSRLETDFYDPSKCVNRIGELKDLVRKKGSEFRVARAMLRYTAGAGNMIADALRKVGDKATLGALDIVLPGEKVPLSSDEKTQVAALQKAVDSEASAEVDNQIKILSAKVAEMAKDPKRAEMGPGSAAEDESLPGWFKSWYRESDHGTKPNSPTAKPSKSDAFLAQRQAHFGEFFQKYSQTLGDARIIAYVDKREPDDAAIKKAADQLLANGKKVRADAAATLANGRIQKKTTDYEGTSVEEDVTPQEKLEKLSSFMQNGAVVRDILKELGATGEDASSCRAAVGVTKYLSHKSTEKGILVGAGMLAAGIIAPIAIPAMAGGAITAASVGMAVTAVSSGQSLYGDFVKFQDAKRRTLNSVHSDDSVFGAGYSINEVSELQEARNGLVINAAITLASTVVPEAYKQFFKENESKYSTAVVLRELKKNGMTEAQSKQLILDLNSQDKTVAAKAISQISKTMHVEEGEIKTFQAIVQKELLDPAGRDQVELYSRRLHEIVQDKDPVVAAAKREKIFDQMQSLIGELKAGDVNVTKRADAMRVVLAASAFNDGDPQLLKRAAGSIKSWDEGLYGLARTYDQARVNMLSAEIQALAPELRKEAAFKKALTGLGVTDPALAAKMCSCSGACPLH